MLKSATSRHGRSRCVRQVLGPQKGVFSACSYSCPPLMPRPDPRPPPPALPVPDCLLQAPLLSSLNAVPTLCAPERPAVENVIAAEKMAEYRRDAERRQEARAHAVAARRARALRVATDAAQVLRREFSARRVVLFGSAGRPERFHPRSDVDLAVWGTPESLYLKAVGRLVALDTEIGVDLVRMEEAPPSFAEAVKTWGIEL